METGKTMSVEMDFSTLMASIGHVEHSACAVLR